MKEKYQVPAFLNLTITGDFFGRILSIIVGYGITFYLMKEKLISFETLKLYYFIFFMSFDIICFILSLTFTQDYFYDKTIRSLKERAEDGNNLKEQGFVSSFINP